MDRSKAPAPPVAALTTKLAADIKHMTEHAVIALFGEVMNQP